jgi:hypothetical protein
MEKRSSPKKRKSAKSPVDKEKSAPTVRDAGRQRFLYRSDVRLKDVLVHLRKRGDYVIVANPFPGDAEVIEDISIETVPWQAISDSAIDPIIDRATEVIGDRQEAMRWLGAPVRGLDFATPISLLGTEEGQIRVNDILGQMEHGIW